jgi:hypothetical protein
VALLAQSVYLFLRDPVKTLEQVIDLDLFGQGNDKVFVEFDNAVHVDFEILVLVLVLVLVGTRPGFEILSVRRRLQPQPFQKGAFDGWLGDERI